MKPIYIDRIVIAFLCINFLNHLKPNEMKKVIMTAVIAFAGITAANAQASDQVQGGFTINVVDYLDLTPSGNFGNVWSATFNDATSMNNGASSSVFSFDVDANRAWTAVATTTDFHRSTPTVHDVPASAIMTWTTGGTCGINNGIAASSAGVAVAAASTGGFNQPFTLQGNIVGGSLYAQNMSGEYSSTTTVVASLN
jgi:hypothetical protein